MPRPSLAPAVAFLLLAALMAATRVHHFASIPDASWAVFFAAGFYLKKQWRWAFPALMAIAVLADWYVIHNAGMDFWRHYCVSAAYWFLVPTHAALWLGGAWLARRKARRWETMAALAAALLASVSLAYLISNGSFYWLSDSWLAGRERSIEGWLLNLSHWYLPYLKTTAMYVAGMALLHVALGRVWPATQPGASEQSVKV